MYTAPCRRLLAALALAAAVAACTSGPKVRADADPESVVADIFDKFPVPPQGSSPQQSGSSQ
jgi:hypothetical protein